MRISLCNEVLADHGFARQCELARQMGYDGLELAPGTLSPDPHLLSAGERKEIRRIAEDNGVPVTGLHYLLMAPKGLSITATDAAVRARTVDVIRRLIALAHDLGGTIIVHGSPAQRRLEPGHEADGRRYGVECWAAIAQDAEAAGITYCVEPLHQPDANFVNTVEEAAAIVRQIGSPALRTMIDCSAATIFEKQPVTELIRQWMPTGLIAHMHFNDPNRRGPGDGTLHFGPIIAALRETGYAGNASIEPFIYIPDCATCAARNIGYMRGVMDGLSFTSP
jgi:sugar phosphate isomerase/epimerase